MKIAVICAFPAQLNPGMLSVDLAFQDVILSPAESLDVTYFCAEREFDLSIDNNDTFLHYNFLQSQIQLGEFDLIVYWGDFLHWIGYFEHDFSFRSERIDLAKTKTQIADLWYQLFFLENKPELQSRAVIFGGTLYGLTATQLTDQRYFAALNNLYSRAQSVLMRDGLSASVVSTFLPAGQTTFGCDCALLLNSQALCKRMNAKLSSPPPERYILSSFSRSGASFVLNSFAAYLASVAGLKLRRVNWLDKSGVPGLAVKLNLIKNATYIFTDFYHLAVSALREHVPVLGFGNATSDCYSTLSDKKKEIFFRQSLASENYIYTEKLIECLSSDDKLRDKAIRCVEVLENKSANELVFNTIDRHKLRAAQALQICLNGGATTRPLIKSVT